MRRLLRTLEQELLEINPGFTVMRRVVREHGEQAAAIQRVRELMEHLPSCQRAAGHNDRWFKRSDILAALDGSHE